MQRFLLTGLALAALTGAAFAQESSAPPPSGAAPPPPAADAGSPPPSPPGEDVMRDGPSRDRLAFSPHGRRGDMGFYRGYHRGPSPSKAARFRIEDGDTRIDLKCAEDEPMKACADLLLQVMDRLQGPMRP
ncbi:hypothetical protein ATY76_03990 [Rhizobium sp. R339]|uniref:hypothetical protein n=1 Tax=Rhizobium sp. R339 TaxID=1764273 RepID=UPI000B52C7CB|nr:hypothetical protein [Rhizobium sp. R339]OWV77119.1 hypothetical protein ATY76_03990 [Rhizobium sp. R339]